MKLVTAGTSRVGREIVKRLGEDVTVHYYKNKALAKELSKHTIQADLSGNIPTFLGKVGMFNIIINNFAFVEDGKSLASWEKIFRANVILPALLLDHMNSGVMINISSIMGLPKIGSGIAYGMSKAALNKFSDTVHKPGVRVNAVALAGIGEDISAEAVADEVIRIIEDTSIDNQVIYLWGSNTKDQRYAI